VAPPIDRDEMARPRSKHPPKTAVQRQAKCRAIKRGTWRTCQEVPCDTPASCSNPNHALPSPQNQWPALTGPTRGPRAAVFLPPPPEPGPTRSSQRALPAPARGDGAASTAIQKAGSSGASADAFKLALLDADGDGAAAALQLSLPPAVAARLRSLLERHDSGMGKPLTAAERAEAQGLLDIAEFFVVHRLRRRLAA
jgi:hypothetical protein